MRYAALLLGVAACAWGQSSEATISGIVTDPHGAVIASAEVAAINVDTGVKTSARTNESGFYSLRSLPIGSYTVQADLSGFRRHVRNGIALTTGQALELNIALELGAVSETVTVSASTPLLETRASDASQLVESKTVEDMPLGDRRAMNLIEITGAAVFAGYDGGSKPNFSLAGGRMQSQMFWIDGATGQNMRLGTGQIDVDPPIDTLQEVKVMANGFSAEFGGSAGGAVIATTKSGTNRFRGSASEYLRNQRLDAPNFFAPVVNGRKDKPSLRYNVFGATLGGPIRRDKTFFFASYEGSRRRDGSIRTLTVPTALQRGGDFSQTFNGRKDISVIYDPYTGRGSNPVVRDPFPGNRVPSSRFDKVALNLLPLYPEANRAADDITGANNFRANDVNALTRNNYLIKIDHNLGNNDKLSARYLYNSDISARRSVFPVPAADTVNDNDYHQQYWYGTWTRIVSPSTVNEARFTYGRRYSHTFSKGLDQGWPGKLGIKGVPDDAFPQINAGSFTDLGSGTQDRRQFPIQQFHVLDNLTWVRGRHTFKFGGELRPSFNYEVFRPSVSGRFTFGRGMTGLPNNAQTGNPMATMLLGIVTNFEQRETQVLDRRTRYLGGFVQDDWLVHPGLTLNIGLRWETDTPIADTGNRINGFDPLATNPVSGTPGVVRFAGVNGWRATPYEADWNNFGPRFGFAWRPFGVQKTVVRGGYGIFYAHPFDRAVANAATLGYELSSTLVLQENSLDIPYTLAGGLPITKAGVPVLDDSFGAVALGKTANTAVTFFETDRRNGYSQQFNLRIQQELPGRAMVEIGYLGNLSRKLGGANMNINQIRPELLQPTSSQRNRPFPQFSNVTLIAPALGVSAYHAGVLRLEKRFSRGVNILATYTWSKFLDNSGSGSGSKIGDEGNPYSDFYNRRNDWGPSENDVRHRLTWSSVYQIPIGKGRRYLAAHPLRHLLGSWQAGAVMVVQTGAPSTVQTQTNTTYSYSSGPQRADILRDPNLPSDQRSIIRWFDTDAFRQPGVNRFGNQGVGLVRCDGLWNWNGSLIRAFQLTERANLQFRGEFFNIPNHTNFGIPGHTFEGAGFGVVNSARPARQAQLGLRLTY